jgi:hypothetical protein
MNPRNFKKKKQIQWEKLDFSDACTQNYIIFILQSEAINVCAEMDVKPTLDFSLEIASKL